MTLSVHLVESYSARLRSVATAFALRDRLSAMVYVCMYVCMYVCTSDDCSLLPVSVYTAVHSNQPRFLSQVLMPAPSAAPNARDANSSPDSKGEAYLSRHQGAIETRLGEAIEALVAAQADEPIAHIGKSLLASVASKETRSAVEAAAAMAANTSAHVIRPSTTVRPRPSAATQMEWSCTEFVSSLGASAVISQALRCPLGGADGAPALQYIRAIGSSPVGRDAVLHLLRTGDVLEALADELWRGFSELHAASAATGVELHEKFCGSGAFTMSFGGLDVFLQGLEAVVGPPMPALHEAMVREHCHAADSQKPFR